ncbi:PREDICTED: type I inositol polyphosphate 5-phosphatase 5 [Tarenaya hassleriana]|uniref:type I inositol polyphosphate 5-phosphatase 5 n=1 Tax=Tarenaya hassleriana TaxID=28532 RepID=UPI00053CA034|nr:PREDICTED: type I inositol polyphosphate 5-phosphatase 5 [Tarenaya hassleriana]
MSPRNESDSENSVRSENRRKKSILPKIFGSRRCGKEEDASDMDSRGCDGDDGVFHDLERRIASRKKPFLGDSPMSWKTLSERQASPGIEGLNLSSFERRMTQATEVRELRVLVATWNVGGRTPNTDLNLEEFLLLEGTADLYICGFQEIVPLSAGNVLVVEDNEPAAKWIALISQALNKPSQDTIYSNASFSGSRITNKIHNSSMEELKSQSSLGFFPRPSLKVLSRNFRVDSSLLKTCNCPVLENSPGWEGRRTRKLSDPTDNLEPVNFRVHENFLFDDVPASTRMPGKMDYRLIASKQMVGLFLSVWARKELIPHIAHLRLDSVGRGIMGRLGNKGCIAISMSLHQTSFCFVCSHLASGEKEGDEFRRNADVAEILKHTQFPKISKNPNCHAAEKIVEHDRVIWLGDLNYRVALSYEETRVLLEDNDWSTLLEKDQLNIEREAGRVFSGFREGQILFAPTYKYSHDSDSYAGETTKSKKKRRTPAWCDRILWRGNGIEQLSYIRGESRFSDHRPVCAVFAVEVKVKSPNRSRFRKGLSCAAARLAFEDCIPQRHSFYD